jgi:hypothetical protein
MRGMLVHQDQPILGFGHDIGVRHLPPGDAERVACLLRRRGVSRLSPSLGRSRKERAGISKAVSRPLPSRGGVGVGLNRPGATKVKAAPHP